MHKTCSAAVKMKLAFYTSSSIFGINVLMPDVFVRYHVTHRQIWRWNGGILLSRVKYKFHNVD